MSLAWEDDSKYIIYNSGISEKKIISQHTDIKKIFTAISHSSDKAEKIPKEELKTIIQESGLLN